MSVVVVVVDCVVVVGGVVVAAKHKVNDGMCYSLVAILLYLDLTKKTISIEMWIYFSSSS